MTVDVQYPESAKLACSGCGRPFSGRNLVIEGQLVQCPVAAPATAVKPTAALNPTTGEKP